MLSSPRPSSDPGGWALCEVGGDGLNDRLLFSLFPFPSARAVDRNGGDKEAGQQAKGAGRQAAAGALASALLLLFFCVGGGAICLDFSRSLCLSGSSWNLPLASSPPDVAIYRSDFPLSIFSSASP